MAKGQFLNRAQQGIVKRYYAGFDSAQVLKLQELVSDLALAADAKAADKLWKRAEETLGKAGVEVGKIEKIVQSRNLEALARVVGEVSARK